MGVTAAGLLAMAAPPASAASPSICVKADATLGLSAKAACLFPAEKSAVQIRLLQTDLMVAALSCDRKHEYNAFVTRHRDELVKGGRGLRALFERVHGKSAKSSLNGYVTKLANDASMRSLKADNYCGAMATLFNQVLTISPAGIAVLAEQVRGDDTEMVKAEPGASQRARLEQK
jgi:hypothetical protein